MTKLHGGMLAALVVVAGVFGLGEAHAQLSIPFDFNFSGGSAAPDHPMAEPVPPPSSAAPAIASPKGVTLKPKAASRARDTKRKGKSVKVKLPEL